MALMASSPITCLCSAAGGTGRAARTGVHAPAVSGGWRADMARALSVCLGAGGNGASLSRAACKRRRRLARHAPLCSASERAALYGSISDAAEDMMYTDQHGETPVNRTPMWNGTDSCGVLSHHSGVGASGRLW